MTVTLYKKDNLQGESFTITDDISDLKDTPVKHGSSSMRITNDKIILFTKKDWKGDAMFRTGTREITKLSSKSKGGKTGFGNTVSSARITPFTIPLFVNIIAKSDGSFPGFRSDDSTLTRLGSGTDIFSSFIRDIIQYANNIWNNFLIHLDVSEIHLRRSDDLHNMKSDLYPLLWKDWQKPKHANVFLVGSLHNAAGICPPVGFGRGAVVDCGSTPDTDRAGDTLAHELGHYFGISKHVNDTGANLMTKDSAISSGILTDEQVEEIHHTLATNVLRKGLRNS